MEPKNDDQRTEAEKTEVMSAVTGSAVSGSVPGLDANTGVGPGGPVSSSSGTDADSTARVAPAASGPAPAQPATERTATAQPPSAGPGTTPPGTTPPGTAGVPLEDAPRVERPTRRRWPRRVAWIVAVPVALVLLLVLAWGIDTAVAGDDVARNTDLAGVPVGGMTPVALESEVVALAAQLPETEVIIDTGEFELESTAGDLGIGIDVDATTRTVTEVGTTAAVWQRPFEWAGSFFTPRAAPVELSVDDETMDATIAELESDKRVAPVEPTMTVTDGVASLVEGTDGIGTAPAVVSDALPESLEDVSAPIRVEVERSVVPPRTPDEAITALVEQANAIAQRTITVSAGEQSFELSGADIIDGVQIDPASDEPRLTISDEVVGTQILEQTDGYKNPTGVTFTSGNGGLVPVAGTDAEVCCGEGATQAIVDALIAGQPEVEVPTRTMTAAEGVQWASGLGVNQVVSEFTTPHKCCQGRVTNIHTIADRIRGTLIAPGETFSVNDLTGRRTTDKGYVPAPAIVDGEHVDDVGGGVSQFATTMFNAAFFAGLPIPEYKMHSEYISRYPYAREATLFYPGVDLKVRNDTPYGIVIWPTYTDTSVTVQLWSTPYARGEESGKSKTSGCGSVTTTRLITYPDGSTDSDSFRANYRCI